MNGKCEEFQTEQHGSQANVAQLLAAFGKRAEETIPEE